MKVSLSWLKEYLNLDNITTEELYNDFSLHISEVETMKQVSSATNLVVGHVLEKVAHPDSDHLNICQVDLGDYKTQIVCGAPNVDVNQKVIVALPGAVLPGDFKIKPSKVRGVESNGMICSLQELGFAENTVEDKYKDGIYVLPSDIKAGTDAVKLLGLEDTIFDLELTSNRSDLLSIEGIAYDLGAYLGQKPNIKTPAVKEVRMVNPIQIDINTDNCHEYQARYIKDVKIAESPLWLKLRLMSLGMKPINNVVDITNLVLLELGQPLHAYDMEITGNKIVVRNALEGEKFTTLDKVERTLKESDVLISNSKEGLCLGGIMGGLNSEITDTTTEILLEAAYFNPLTIRKTSSRLGLKSESSIRFERKVCQERISRALDLAASLINEIAGGVVCGSINSVVTKAYEKKYVTITREKINSVLGTNLSLTEVEKIFNNLNYVYELTDEQFEIEIPSRRMDLEESYQDIIEDVVRMIGYENVPTTMCHLDLIGSLTEKQRYIRLIRQTLASLGLNEVVNYSLLSENDVFKYSLEEVSPIKVLMPLTSDRAVMRTSLINGLIETIKYNKSRQMPNVSCFEIGKVYSTDTEVNHLSGAFTGMFESSLWQGKKNLVDFYLVKGIVDELARRLNKEFTYVPYTDIKDTYHKGQAAKILLNDQEIGFIASLHPSLIKEYNLDKTICFDLNLDLLLADKSEFKYEPLAKYPQIERDLAVVVKDEVLSEDLLKVVRMVSKKYLVDAYVFDIYKGKGLNDDEKSVAIKMIFQDKTKTLESETIDKIINSLLNRLDFYYKARLR